MAITRKGNIFFVSFLQLCHSNYELMIEPASLLTPKEKEVMMLLRKGLSYKGIAKIQGVSPETIKKHLKNIYRKLQVQNKVEALVKLKLL